MTSYENGYIEASFDSLSYSGKILTAYLRGGKQYIWSSLQAKEEYLSDAGFNQKNYSGKKLSPTGLSSLFEKLLRYSENSGYPFAKVKMDSVVFDGTSVSAKLQVEKGDLIVIDSIIVKGDSKLSQAYLNNYLSIRPR